MANHYDVYTDASFDPKRHLAVAGFCILKNAEEKPLVHIHQFEEKNNIRSELRGALIALEAAETHRTAVTLYTDCQGIFNLPQRREKLESCGYKSNRKNTPLANADLYQAFFLISDRLNLKIIWVKGHSPSANQTLIQKNFRVVDQAVRKKLRAAAPHKSDLSVLLFRQRWRKTS